MTVTLFRPGVHHHVWWTAAEDGLECAEVFCVENPPDHPSSPYYELYLQGVTAATVERTAGPWVRIVSMGVTK